MPNFEHFKPNDDNSEELSADDLLDKLNELDPEAEEYEDKKQDILDKLAELQRTGEGEFTSQEDMASGLEELVSEELPPSEDGEKLEDAPKFDLEEAIKKLNPLDKLDSEDSALYQLQLDSLVFYIEKSYGKVFSEEDKLKVAALLERLSQSKFQDDSMPEDENKFEPQTNIDPILDQISNLDEASPNYDADLEKLITELKKQQGLDDYLDQLALRELAENTNDSETIKESRSLQAIREEIANMPNQPKDKSGILETDKSGALDIANTFDSAKLSIIFPEKYPDFMSRNATNEAFTPIPKEQVADFEARIKKIAAENNDSGELDEEQISIVNEYLDKYKQWRKLMDEQLLLLRSIDGEREMSHISKNTESNIRKLQAERARITKTMQEIQARMEQLFGKLTQESKDKYLRD